MNLRMAARTVRPTLFGAATSDRPPAILIPRHVAGFDRGVFFFERVRESLVFQALTLTAAVAGTIAAVRGYRR